MPDSSSRNLLHSHMDDICPPSFRPGTIVFFDKRQWATSEHCEFSLEHATCSLILRYSGGPQAYDVLCDDGKTFTQIHYTWFHTFV